MDQIDNLKTQHSERSTFAASQVPTLWRPLYVRAHSFRASPRQAIKAKCQNCVCYEDARNRISECSTFTCPLWPYRPYQSRLETENEDSENE